MQFAQVNKIVPIQNAKELHYILLQASWLYQTVPLLSLVYNLTVRFIIVLYGT